MFFLNKTQRKNHIEGKNNAGKAGNSGKVKVFNCLEVGKRSGMNPGKPGIKIMWQGQDDDEDDAT